MTEPTIKVLGVYRLNVTDELVREQQSILHGENDRVASCETLERQIREQLNSVVLLEALVLHRDEHFDMGDFTQPQIGIPRDRWQAPWAESYLSLDGTSLVVGRWSTPTPAVRVAFFMHFWDPTAPLQSSYGEVVCPLPQQMSDRLCLVPFEPVD
jgi:hypothetical protein